LSCDAKKPYPSAECRLLESLHFAESDREHLILIYSLNFHQAIKIVVHRPRGPESSPLQHVEHTPERLRIHAATDADTVLAGKINLDRRARRSRWLPGITT
jgi:hypothetical protein